MAGNKYLKNNAGVITEQAAIQSSAGAADAGKIIALDPAGKLDNSFMPTGIGADTASITASENLTAGDYVNIYNLAGVAQVRKADATTSGKEAHGFVLSSVSSAAAATVYFEGSNTAVTGQTPGVVYLSTTAGVGSATPPSAAGNVVQRVGFAVSTTAMNFQSNIPIVLA